MARMFNFTCLVLVSILLVSTLGLVDCLPGPTEDFGKPSRYRKLPEYNCSEVFFVDQSEIDRIKSELKGLKEKNYDLVVLNYTVNLDCLFDSDMNYVRHFIVSSKGKNILKYAVEAEYFPLKIFGLKSTIQNVNLRPGIANDSTNLHKVYTLSNLTFVSKRILGNSGFTDVCMSLKDVNTWNMATFLFFIPKGAIFNENEIICHKSDSRQTVLHTSGLVYGIYTLCFLAAMHLNVLYDLVADELKERKNGWKIYHKDETPFSLMRVIKRMCTKGDDSIPEQGSEKERIDIHHFKFYVYLVVSIPLGLLYYSSVYQRTWFKNVIFLNDSFTLDYIINRYYAPMYKNDWFLGIFSRVFYYIFLGLYLYLGVTFLTTLGPNEVIFTFFKPKNVFTHALKEQTYNNINYKDKQVTPSSHFVQSYKQLFSCDFWHKIIYISTDIPYPASLNQLEIYTARDDDVTLKKIQLCRQFACMCFLGVIGLFEACLYLVCVIVNIFVNVMFIFLRTFCPVLKYFFAGLAQRLNSQKNEDSCSLRYRRSLCWCLGYTIIWFGANLYIFNTVMILCSFFLYLTFIALPFNPSYGVPLVVIVLSLVSYLLMFYEDFQSDYKHLLDIIFEILDDHLIKQNPELDLSGRNIFDLKTARKVKQINVKVFDQLSKKYIPFSRKCAFLFIKLTFTAMCIVISFNALEESGTGIETLKLSDFFSVILLVMIPGIVRSVSGPRESLRRKRLYFQVFKYLKRLDRNNELEAMIIFESEESDSDSQDAVGETVNDGETTHISDAHV